MNPVRVTIVLVNYNGRRFIDDCIESIKLQSFISIACDISIVFVDNGSTDESAEYVREKYPDVIVHSTEKNLGFGVGNNTGVDIALEQPNKPDYVFLLNVDTILDGDLINNLLICAKDYPDAVLIPEIFLNREKTEYWYNGGILDIENGLVEQNIAIEESDISVLNPRQVSFATGCALFIPVGALRRPLFDDSYFLYWEDVDLCAAWNAAEVPLFCVPSAKMWHRVGGSSEGNHMLALYYGVRNRLLFLEKNAKPSIARMREIIRNYNFPSEGESGYYAVQAGIQDYLQGNFGEGIYGRLLLRNGYYPSTGLYMPEFDGGTRYFCRSMDTKASAILINANVHSRTLRYTFDVELLFDLQLLHTIVVKADDKIIYEGSNNRNITFERVFEAYSSCRLDVELLVDSAGADFNRDKCFELMDLKYSVV